MKRASSYPEPLAQALRPFLPSHFVARWPVPNRVDWTPQRLAGVGLLLAWDEGQTLAARFEHACQTAGRLPAPGTLGRSYSGWTRALIPTSATLTAALKPRFQRPREALAGVSWRRGRGLAFAAEGTRLETPPTVAHQTDWGGAGKDKTAPQVFLTVLGPMGLGLPWDYRVGPGTASERAHLKPMVRDLPPAALVVADAGFVSYGLGRQWRRQGKHFRLGVGGHIPLRKGLGYYPEERDGLVYLGPHKHRRGRPLVWRWVVLRHGPQDVSRLTAVLDPAQLTEGEAATRLGMRWSEEVFYRSCKQTLKRRQRLSRTAATCFIEAQGTLLGRWLWGLMTVRQRIAARLDRLWFSVARARDAVRWALRDRRARGGPRRLDTAWRAAAKDR